MEELLLNCLPPLICLGGRADLTTEWGGGIILPLAPSQPHHHGFAGNALLDFWPDADMDLSREQQYISTRDTGSWGGGRPCVRSADPDALILMPCQFVSDFFLARASFIKS